MRIISLRIALWLRTGLGELCSATVCLTTGSHFAELILASDNEEFPILAAETFKRWVKLYLFLLTVRDHWVS
jgi:hypothetical protein